MNERQHPTNPGEPQPSATPPAYKVELDAFNGPLDLLLYLIRKEEVDIYDIPIARITEQYLKHIEMMNPLDVNIAGEFIVMAATLLEIKARMMAPEPVLADEEEMQDPRLELVRQLMDYRRFKEAAIALTQQAQERARRFSRAGERVDDASRRMAGAPKNVNLRFLLEAFSRVLEQTGAAGMLTVTTDAIPQERLNAELAARISTVKRLTFFQAFENHTDRVMLVGMFFAILELARQQVLALDQDEPFGEIWLSYIPPEERDDIYESSAAQEGAVADDASAGEEASAFWTSEELGEEMPEIAEVDGKDQPVEN